MPYPASTAVEIDHKLREDFRKRLREYGVATETTDPVLAVLFRTFAQQLELLYSDTERIRLGLLDELISGLGIERRMARPAQTVIRFSEARQTRQIEGGSTLVGETPAGAKLSFLTDASVTVSQARICFGAAYEDGALRLLSGIEMPESFQAARPSLEPVKVNLGPNPAIFLAIDPPPNASLSSHSFYFDLSPDAKQIQSALTRETWCFASPSGAFSAPGILRPFVANTGLRRLDWLVPTRQTANVQNIELEERLEERREELPSLPPGFYAGRIYLLPQIPAERDFRCRLPRGLDAACNKIFGREAGNLFANSRCWLKISLPKGLPALHTGVSNIALHCVTASNVECLNQTITFDKHGTAIPISKEGGSNWHLVAPLSVIGESDTPYLTETEPSTDPLAGRYAIRNGRIDLTPARWPNGKAQAYANVRVWTSSGAAANLVGPGKVASIQLKDYAGGIRVSNPTSAAGGTDGEEFADAQARFTAALLSRDRIVTRADLYAIVKSFDRRVHDTTIRSRLDRHHGALSRQERVTIYLNKDDFNDPEVEAERLVQDLEIALRKRFLHDIELKVQYEWETA